MAYSPDQHILVTATSGAMDGLDTLWNVANPARPRKLASFEGGAPTTLSPDGRTVVTVSFSDQPALWNVASPRKPARITTLRSGDSNLLWGEAFSPDGNVQAVAYTDLVDLWNVTNPARPVLMRTLADPVVPPAPSACSQPCHYPDPFYQGDIAFSPDGRLLAAISYGGTVSLFSLTDPARPARTATMPTLPAAQLAADRVPVPARSTRWRSLRTGERSLASRAPACRQRRL